MYYLLVLLIHLITLAFFFKDGDNGQGLSSIFAFRNH